MRSYQSEMCLLVVMDEVAWCFVRGGGRLGGAECGWLSQVLPVRKKDLKIIDFSLDV